mmetsp:Transcript_27116/g.65496  ORF Transcript_27116/g.65496 Transcript_27116/m.65496 type:complete len:238 (-) Transcript_27116:527-1240(-)
MLVGLGYAWCGVDASLGRGGSLDALCVDAGGRWSGGSLTGLGFRGGWHLRRVVDVDAVDVWVVWVVHEEHPRAIDRALVKGAERMPRYAAVVLHSHAGAHPLVSSWCVCPLSRLDALTPFSAHAAGPEVHDATRSSSSRPIFRSSACRSLMYLRPSFHRCSTSCSCALVGSSLSGKARPFSLMYARVNRVYEPGLGRMGVESRTRLEYVMGTPELRKTYIERNPPERQWTTSKWRPR